uniref:SCP domain-containing protein n=1 Tax=Daphnia galeata TaxID=27404 RepID=A0A8J2RVI5_9CRUS|nr:unnamed protein product [Daphnia galeata]
MRELKWDQELSVMAAAWAQQCVYEHDKCRDVPCFSVGQNLYAISSSEDSLGTSDWNAAVTAWYNEVMDMNPADVPNFQSNPLPVIEHYTQVVWADTYLVGCAVTYFQSTTTEFGPQSPYIRFYVCNYGPGGNTISCPLYNQGSAGSACPAGPSSSYTGLCA